jgi:trans-aconitate 2-methyltransferase
VLNSFAIALPATAWRRSPKDLIMSDWDAENYDRFASPRQRPCRDLLTAVPPLDGRLISDLGCGSGLSTALLAARWPDAEISGIDNSPTMLGSARKRVPNARFTTRDIAQWQAESPQDLILANASLQWLPDHTTLLPALLGMLTPDGILAIQMPNNLQEPSHRLMHRVADNPRYREHMHKLTWSRQALLPTSDYYDCLAPICTDVEIWETIYQHVLPGVSAIVDWFSSTALKPFLDALPASEQPAFKQDYLTALETAYPQRADGRILLTMPRLFIVAKR